MTLQQEIDQAFIDAQAHVPKYVMYHTIRFDQPTEPLQFPEFMVVKDAPGMTLDRGSADITPPNGHDLTVDHGNDPSAALAAVMLKMVP